MVDARDVEGISLRDTDPSGHAVIYSFDIPNFAGSLSYTFEKSMSFHCKVMPTSWKFRVIFERSPVDYSVFSRLVIRRMDYGLDEVGVNICMEVIPRNMLVKIPAIWIIGMMIPRSGIRTELLRGLVPSEVMRELGDRTVNFRFTFGVYGCHSDKNLNFRSDVKHQGIQLFPSKM